MWKNILSYAICLSILGLFFFVVSSDTVEDWAAESRIERKRIALDRQLQAKPRIQELGEGEVVSLSKPLGQTGLTSTVVKRSDGFIMSAWALSTQDLTVGQKVQIARVECGGNETGMSGSNNEVYWVTSK